LVAACGGPSADPTATSTPVPPTATPATATPTQLPTTGSITGTIVGDDGKPLFKVNDEEILVVALVCPDGGSHSGCFPEITQDMDFASLHGSICEAEDNSSSCLVRYGQGATHVAADGSYTMADTAPGHYGLVCLFWVQVGSYAVGGYSIQRDVAPIVAGKTTEHDIAVSVHR
jgi:hypothetical protein